MEQSVLILNLSDQEDMDFQMRAVDFTVQSNKRPIAVPTFDKYDATVFNRDHILKVILYYDLAETSEDELVRRLLILNESYAPFHDQVYVRDNEGGPFSKILKTNFLYSHLHQDDDLFANLEEVLEEEELVEMAEPELYAIWQDILNGILVVKPARIEKLSSDINSVFIRGMLFLKKGNRGTSFELFKNLFMTNQKYFPVMEVLKEFDDMKDKLPMEYYLNYKLINKIKQGKVNYLKEEDEKKKKRKSDFNGIPNEEKIKRSKFNGVPNEDKTLKKFKLDYNSFAELKNQLSKLGKLSIEKLRALNEEANMLSRQGKFEEAVEVYKKVYTQVEKSKQYKILLNIGIAYKRAKDWKKSLHYAQETLKRSPSNSKAIELRDFCKAKISENSNQAS